MMPSRSARTLYRMIWPSRNVIKLTLRPVKGRPDGGTPNSGPRCTPSICQKATTRSPSATRSVTVARMFSTVSPSHRTCW
jgi:hypothetical protein